jgi:ribosomal protein S27E
MKISDINCKKCGTSYQVAESTTVSGSSSEAACAICGDTLAKWDDGKLKAFRIVIAPDHKYARVPVPPSQMR